MSVRVRVDWPSASIYGHGTWLHSAPTVILDCLHCTAIRPLAMTAMEYYPRTRPYRTTCSASIESSDSQTKSNLRHCEEVASDLSVEGSLVYILPGPPSAPPTLAIPRLNTCSAPVGFSEQLSLMLRDESIDGSTGAISSSSMEVTHDWESVRSVRQLPAKIDDSECRIEEWYYASHDTMQLTDESGSSAFDEDALHASRWDLVPEYSPRRVPQNTPVLRMHGRPLESRRWPPERMHKSARPPAPHPRIRLPLLSVFVSLLSIDDATLHLVAHSPAHSTLFPGPIGPSDERTGNTQESHGTLRLLEPSSQLGALRDGLAVACDESFFSSNPFRLSVSPLIGLLGLVRGIWTG
ncbi:hypothetical protein BJV74DRAFT_389638 [Russula compacta]|nr:hypothetical protein BJV74DRAFT_389638 [Russula compacta]